MQKKITESVLEICKAKNFPGTWVVDGCELSHTTGMGIHVLQCCQHYGSPQLVKKKLSSGSRCNVEMFSSNVKIPKFVLYRNKSECDEIADHVVELDTLDELSDTLEFLSALFQEESGTIETLESIYGVSVKDREVSETQRWLKFMAGSYECQTEYTDYSQCSCLASSTMTV